MIFRFEDIAKPCEDTGGPSMSVFFANLMLHVQCLKEANIIRKEKPVQFIPQMLGSG
jgi:hypothetical protein